VSNKQKLKSPITIIAHLDDYGTVTCGGCGREVGSYIGMVDEYHQYKCSCGRFVYTTNWVTFA